MASEWAREKAKEIINTNLDDPSRVPRTTASIAEALDAARIEGLEEAAKIVDAKRTSSSDSHRPTVICLNSGWNSAINSIAEDIRARIREMKG